MISFNQRVYKGVLLPIIFFSYNILISYSSDIASVYTRQGLIGIGKRSSYHDLYICIPAKYISNLSHRYLWCFMRIKYSAVRGYIENRHEFICVSTFEEFQLIA